MARCANVRYLFSHAHQNVIGACLRRTMANSNSSSNCAFGGFFGSSFHATSMKHRLPSSKDASPMRLGYVLSSRKAIFRPRSTFEVCLFETIRASISLRSNRTKPKGVRLEIRPILFSLCRRWRNAIRKQERSKKRNKFNYESLSQVWS